MFDSSQTPYQGILNSTNQSATGGIPVQRIFFHILRCWTRRLLLLWTESSTILTSTEGSVSRNRKPRKRIGFHEEDRSPSWSTTTFEWLALVIQYSKLCWFILCYSSWLQHSGIRYKMGRSSVVDVKNTHWMISWKVSTDWEYVSLIKSIPL